MTSRARGAGSELVAASVLASVRSHRADREAAERGMVEDAITWAALHEVSEDDSFATWPETPIAVTGEGAPLLGEFCVAEFAAALGLRTGAGRAFLADAVELAHRLPRVLEQVRRGRVQVFTARRIAQRTQGLTLAGAAFVDARVAVGAARVSLAQVERLVEEARARFQPEEAAKIARRAAERRHVVVETWQVSFDGTSRVQAELDLADALDLEDAITLVGKQIERDHPELTWDACRAKAMGVLARGELILRAPETETRVPPRRRDLNLVVHLQTNPDDHPDALDQSVFLERGKKLLVLEQIKAWAGDATRVIIRPVIDLHQDLSVTGYEIPAAIEEHVGLRDRTCRFPYCERLARSCDTDHTVPYDPKGPPGQTATENLAPLCRHHHRLKTHAGWTYTRIEPGVHIWRSPHGYSYLTDSTGTRDLTPPSAARPRAAA